MSSDVAVMSGDPTPPLGDDDPHDASGRVTPSPRWRSIASTATNRFGLVGVLITVIAVYTALMPGTFDTVANLRVITATQSVVIIMSLGLTFPLAVGSSTSPSVRWSPLHPAFSPSSPSSTTCRCPSRSSL